jgi:hypothetical protein
MTMEFFERAADNTQATIDFAGHNKNVDNGLLHNI